MHIPMTTPNPCRPRSGPASNPELDPAHPDDLKKSGLTDETILAAGLRTEPTRPSSARL
jgi:hypothetical protein